MKAKISKETQITLSLIEVKCESFNLTEYAKENKDRISFDGYEFVFTFNVKLDTKQELYSTTIDINLYQKKDSSAKAKLANVKARSAFKIIDFNKHVIFDKELNQYQISNSILILCNNIALSNARGMLSVKLEDTLYSNAVLPLVDESTLLPQ